MTVRVRVLLGGHEFDLQALADMFPEGDPSVVRDTEGQYHLHASELEPPFTDGGKMLDLAEVVLGRLSAAARLDSGDFRQVFVVGTFDRPSSSGGTETSVNLTDSAVGRDRATVARAGVAEGRASARAVAAATGPDGEVTTPEPRGNRYLRLAKAHPEVVELLDLLSTSDMSWDDLYKAFEIVRESSKHGQKARWSLEQLGYAKAEVDAFTLTVNLHRHARPSGQPRRELTLVEAQQFVRDLADRWFRALDSSGDQPPS